MVGFDQVAALLLLNLAVWAALDWLHAPAQAPLELDGLFGWACYLLLGLGACALVARVQSRAADTRTLLVACLTVTPFLLILLWLGSDAAALREHLVPVTVVVLVYLAGLVLRLLQAAYGLPRWPTVLAALVLLVGSPFVFGFLNLDTRLWVAEEPAQAQTDEDQAETEALFYEQPGRIEAAVERVRLTNPGKAGVYFVGFAGDGNPALFRREAQFASEVFGERFGSADRQVLLINDVEDHDSYPLASVTGLAQTLKLLAARMDPENDVLVLFLTSHGSQEGLEVQNGSLPLAQLGPSDLREALDDAGIRWRVIVVSACYAGVFIDELKSDTTAIITAADAGHSSFGCEDDRDLTWFGEAFLKDSLPGSASLEDAFHKSAALINEREEAGHQVHSNPQLFVGPLMKKKLGELEMARPAPEHGSFTVRR
ncbi:MAG TPA: C13 family peptidase [Steroidobacteraceae bacterium]|nr:C13 family peptidase [Steroidobacteraceae bacterium]